jgi:putative membrane protein
MTVQKKIMHAAALVAGLALAGQAQAQKNVPWTEPPAQNPPAQTPPPATPPAATPPTTATPPAATPPVAATPPAGTPAATAATGQQAIEAIHQENARTLEFARLVAERATSPKLKEYASRLVRDHERLDRELAQIAGERGIQLQSEQAALAANPAHRPGMDALRAKSGADFDQAAAQAIADEREREVAHLKQLRDATPGKDAKLKKWLDDAENVMEEHRNLARDVRKDTQRQARTPKK